MYVRIVVYDHFLNKISNYKQLIPDILKIF